MGLYFLSQLVILLQFPGLEGCQPDGLIVPPGGFQIRQHRLCRLGEGDVHSPDLLFSTPDIRDLHQAAACQLLQGKGKRTPGQVREIRRLPVGGLKIQLPQRQQNPSKTNPFPS